MSLTKRRADRRLPVAHARYCVDVIGGSVAREHHLHLVHFVRGLRPGIHHTGGPPSMQFIISPVDIPFMPERISAMP